MAGTHAWQSTSYSLALRVEHWRIADAVACQLKHFCAGAQHAVLEADKHRSEAENARLAGLSSRLTGEEAARRAAEAAAQRAADEAAAAADRMRVAEEARKACCSLLRMRGIQQN